MLIVYEGGSCPHCKISTKNSEIITDEDILQRAKQNLRRSALNILMVFKALANERAIFIPKSYIRQIINISTGVTISRQLKTNKIKYACGCIAHITCANKYCSRHNKCIDSYISIIKANLHYGGSTTPH